MTKGQMDAGGRWREWGRKENKEEMKASGRQIVEGQRVWWAFRKKVEGWRKQGWRKGVRKGGREEGKKGGREDTRLWGKRGRLSGGWRDEEGLKEACRDGQSERRRGGASAPAGLCSFRVQMSKCPNVLAPLA